MHDTAFQIGTLAMNMYADLASASVLEVGSLSVNGGLRGNAFPTTNYVGIDLEEGEGVDRVIETGKPFPVEEGSFDLVLASSVFEHDPNFWTTFIEMCRAAKDGGYIYVNAPSNGNVHRYPHDCWRFYPDAGLSLQQWAVRQGLAITLVESFIAERNEHMWNDFVAVFRKGRITDVQPSTFLHDHVPSVNVRTWTSMKLLREREEPQDLVLLEQARSLADRLWADLESSKATLAAAEDRAARVAPLEQELSELQSQLVKAHEHVQRIEPMLEEVPRLRADLEAKERELEAVANNAAQGSRERDALSAELAERDRQLKEASQLTDRLSAELERLCAELETVSAQRDAVQEKLDSGELQKAARDEAFENELREQLDTVRSDALIKAKEEYAKYEVEIEGKLAKRFQEIATLTTRLRRQEEREQSLLVRGEWLTALLGQYDRLPRRWFVLNAAARRKELFRRLQSSGVFDAEAYLRTYPDVGQAGFDPLDHYVRHGSLENRSPLG